MKTANIDLKITGVRGGDPKWQPNKGQVINFIDGSDNYISLDTFRGGGDAHTRRDTTEIEIKFGTETWNGNASQLAEILFPHLKDERSKKEEHIRWVIDKHGENLGFYGCRGFIMDFEKIVVPNEEGKSNLRITYIHRIQYRKILTKAYYNGQFLEDGVLEWSDVPLNVIEELMDFVADHEEYKETNKGN